MFTKKLDPSVFGRALTLINLVRPDGSKFKVAGACCTRTQRVPPRARHPPPAVDFNILVLKSLNQFDYFNFFAVK